MFDEKEPIEVKQWQEYLIYASIFGVASNISDKFDKINVDNLDFANINVVDDFMKNIMVPTIKNVEINKK